MSVFSSRYRRRREAIEASVPLDDVMKPEQFWDLLMLDTPTACEHCGEAFFGFKAGARHCSSACRVRGHRQSRRPRNETAEDRRLNQRDAKDMIDWGKQDPGWRERAQQVVYGGDSADNPKPPPPRRSGNRSVFRCVECGVYDSTGCDCCAPVRLLLTFDGGLTATPQAWTGSSSDGPCGMTFDRVWVAVQGGAVIVHRDRNHKIQSGTSSTGYRRTDEPWMLPEDAASLRAEIARHHQQTTTPDAHQERALMPSTSRTTITTTSPTISERMASIEVKLDAIFASVAESAERLRETFPTNAEVGAAVDAFLDGTHRESALR